MDAKIEINVRPYNVGHGSALAGVLVHQPSSASSWRMTSVSETLTVFNERVLETADVVATVYVKARRYVSLSPLER